MDTQCHIVGEAWMPAGFTLCVVMTFVVHCLLVSPVCVCLISPRLSYGANARGFCCSSLSGKFIFLSSTPLQTCNFHSLLIILEKGIKYLLPPQQLGCNEPLPQAISLLLGGNRKDWEGWESPRRPQPQSASKPSSQHCRTNPFGNCILTTVCHIHHITLTLLPPFLCVTPLTLPFLFYCMKGLFYLRLEHSVAIVFPTPMSLPSLCLVCLHLDTLAHSTFLHCKGRISALYTAPKAGQLTSTMF